MYVANSRRDTYARPLFTVTIPGYSQPSAYTAGTGDSAYTGVYIAMGRHKVKAISSPAIRFLHRSFFIALLLFSCVCLYSIPQDSPFWEAVISAMEVFPLFPGIPFITRSRSSLQIMTKYSHLSLFFYNMELISFQKRGILWYMDTSVLF